MLGALPVLEENDDIEDKKIKVMSEESTQEESVREKLTEAHTVTITRAQEVYASWFIDVLIYTVVLNLFAQYSEYIRFDTFTISILTALLLKLLVVFLVRIEKRVHHYFEQKEGTLFKVLNIVVTISILILGKLFILEAVDFVFGDRVELGHFVQVLVLVIALIIAHEIADWIYRRLGTGDGTE